LQIVGVDWSGQRSREHHHLWTATLGAEGDAGPLVGRTRVDTAAYLLTLAERDADLIAGLDFGFSLPAWFLSAHAIESVEELWGDTERLERWLAECAPPFWGRPGRPCPADAAQRGWRAAELAAARIGPRPKSVFQIGGAGTVGTGSLRGMPVLARLRAAGFAVWPFDPPTPPVVLEAWPRHSYGGPLVKSDAGARAAAAARLPAKWRETAIASEDAFDAAIMAVGLAAVAGDVSATPAVDHPLAAKEGWIWGVPVSRVTAQLR
jgi:hypothetical protein